jgi:hypothetical protein
MQLAAFRAQVNALMVDLGDANMQVAVAALKSMTEALSFLENIMSSPPGQALGAELMLVAEALKVMAAVLAPVLVLAPAVAAGSKIAKSFGFMGPAAEGAALGIGSRLGLRFLPGIGQIATMIESVLNDDPKKTLEWEKGILESIWRGLTGATVNVQVKVGDKDVAAVVTKEVVRGANGPSTGTRNSDPRRGYTPSGN